MRTCSRAPRPPARSLTSQPFLPPHCSSAGRAPPAPPARPRGLLCRHLPLATVAPPSCIPPHSSFPLIAPPHTVLAGKAVYIGPDQFNKGHTAPRKYLSKHYSEGAAERLYKETLELIRAKGFEVPEAQ